MVSNKDELNEKIPTVKEYQIFRNSVGWPTVSDEAAEKSLMNSLYCVCIVRNKQVIAMGRLVGDAGIYYYVADIIVLPRYQRQGLGKRIMNSIMKYLDKHADPTAFIGLMAAKGFWRFYEHYGFQKRPLDAPGMFKYLS